MTSGKTLLQQVLAGTTVGPITRAMSAWNGSLTVEAIERVNQLRLTDLTGDRSSGAGRFRGSLLGACPRMQILSYDGNTGSKPDEVGLEIMRDGTERHYLWQQIGLSAGFLTDVERKNWSDELSFGGQVDGDMAPQESLPGVGGFELKTTNPTRYNDVVDRGKPTDKHLKQIGGYCEAGGYDWFSVVYEVRSWQWSWVEFVVHYDDTIKAMVNSEFDMLHTWRDSDQLPPVKEGYPKDNECKYWCNYTDICPTATRSQP